jgi:hypothetical protein
MSAMSMMGALAKECWQMRQRLVKIKSDGHSAMQCTYSCIHRAATGHLCGFTVLGDPVIVKVDCLGFDVLGKGQVFQKSWSHAVEQVDRRDI